MQYKSSFIRFLHVYLSLLIVTFFFGCNNNDNNESTASGDSIKMVVPANASPTRVDSTLTDTTKGKQPEIKDLSDSTKANTKNNNQKKKK